MEFETDDELIASITTYVMKCLEGARYFEKLDDVLSPEDSAMPVRKCDGSYAISETILVEAGFEPLSFRFSANGSLPGLPTHTWQQLSFGSLRGLRFSNNLLVAARKPVE